ncbi:hypothetical protein P3X46_020230 [Hevea brasiliensis]|uniref:SREBP regulating gene protein n=1 Tax=Hevea brasiliensis TaxID=3981 RepID=A0ABQ9LL90_HEVBR|nr:hypothetical protein P3X46_020230 [Hevea brasiliensis]
MRTYMNLNDLWTRMVENYAHCCRLVGGLNLCFSLDLHGRWEFASTRHRSSKNDLVVNKRVSFTAEFCSTNYGCGDNQRYVCSNSKPIPCRSSSPCCSSCKELFGLRLLMILSLEGALRSVLWVQFVSFGYMDSRVGIWW